jgi:hypothetical protein
VKRKFSEYEDLLVEMQGELDEAKSGKGGGGGGDELAKLKKANAALQEELETALSMLNEEVEKTDLLTEELAKYET